MHVFPEATGGPLIALLLALSSPSALAAEPPGVPVRLERAPVTTAVGHAPGLDPFEWRPHPPVLRGTEPAAVELRLMVPPGFTVYRDQVRVQVLDAADLAVGPPDIPPGITRLVPGRDEAPREQYDHDVVVRIPVQAPAPEPGLQTLHVRVRHQGCFEGHCYRPVERVVPVHVPVRDDASEASAVPDTCDDPAPEAHGTEPRGHRRHLVDPVLLGAHRGVLTR